MDKILSLRAKANSLPLLPGVYLMKDARGTVIYVGKAKALKNRVGSYFTGHHLPKVEAMVACVEDFEVILAESEFEALILENSLIKRHMPHYNILLRDDKGYPSLRVDLREEYPVFTMVNKPVKDGALYLGPYGGRSTTAAALDALLSAMKMPRCSRKFPRDLKKGRPCLNYQMGVCEGWCRGELTAEEYRENIRRIVRILQGDGKSLLAALKKDMLQASEELRFEQAARLRDMREALLELENRQHVVQTAGSSCDALGFARGSKSAFVVLHYAGGNLVSKDLEVFSEPLEEDAAVLENLLLQYYSRPENRAGEILLPYPLENASALEESLSEQKKRRVRLTVPQRGRKKEYTEAAARNASEESLRASGAAEKGKKLLRLLQETLGLVSLPRRIEAYDISNTGDRNIVSSMVVFVDGKPLKRDYRKFHMKDVATQNDFASMKETMTRRLGRWKDGDEKFSPLPDLILIDGGAGQVSAALEAVRDFELSLPVFGMVKDDRHHTRALTDENGREIGIRQVPALFSLIGSIQEETHRTAIGYHRKLRDSGFRSALESIPGVGAKRRQLLLKRFKSLKAIKNAERAELAAVLPASVADSVYEYFHSAEGKEEAPCE